MLNRKLKICNNDSDPELDSEPDLELYVSIRGNFWLE